MSVKPILINVRGAIVQNDRILLVKMNDESGMYFTFPGTSLQNGESLYDAVKRGVRTSTGAKVDIGRLLMVWEYIPERENSRFGDRHKITILFLCQLKPESDPQQPPVSDPNQIDVLWMPLDSLEDLPVIPAIAPQMQQALQSRSATGNLFIDSIQPL